METDILTDRAGSRSLPASTLPTLVAWSCRQFAPLEAIRDGATSLSYQELGEQSDRVARALIASDIQAGDTVAIWAPNCWQWVVASLGALRAGARLVPVNTRFKGPEAAYVLDKASVKLIFVCNGFLDTDYAHALTPEVAGYPLPDLAEVIDFSLDDETGSDPRPRSASTPAPGTRPTVGFEHFCERGAYDEVVQAEVERRSAAVAPDDISLIMFTSGTTGHPKGVMIRGGAMIRAFYGYSEALTVTEGDRYLLVNPYFHAFGFNSGIVVCLLRGAVNVPVAVFEAGEVLALIESQRVTVFPGPPALFQALLNHPDLPQRDVSSLRACVTGAASIPVEMVLDMRERLGFRTIITAYGMTETTGIAAHTRTNDDPHTVATTSGRAIPDTELKIVDDNGDPVPAGTPGELLVRGFQVTPGYLDAPEQTAEAIDPEGWLHTGDVAVMDANGYIDITDRKKDMFIMGGFNAYPAEIERVILEHPLVGIAAVIGVPDDRMGEVGAAFVVPSPDGAPDPESLIGWCRERMANYKVPRYVWVVEDLPLTASNKVRKPELRALAEDRLNQ